jgi:plastocyanin
MAAELDHAGLERHARARRGVLEQQRDRAAVERPRRSRRPLERERTVEQRRELPWGELGAVEEVQAPECTVAPGLLHRLMRIAIATLLLALTLAACGGDDSGGGGEQPASSGECPSEAVVIRMANIKFDPQKATARAGQEICWPNEDAVEHDVTAESGATFKSNLYGKGETFTATVDKPGRVDYICTIHPGMTGSIEVTGSR